MTSFDRDIERLCEAMRADRLDVTPETIIVDGVRTADRCGIIGERGKTDGAYHVYGNAPVSAWWQNHHGGDIKKWCSRSKSEIPHAEWKAIRARFAADQKKRAEELAQARAEARARDRKRWDAGTEYERHPYTDGKGILPHGTRVDRVDGEDRILVPVGDVAGKLHGLQRITPAGVKLFTSGTAVTGNFFVIGEITGAPGERAVEVEGFGTGATVYESTGYPVVVAFDCGNLLPVAKAISKKYPQIDLALCADDDWMAKDGRNRGIEHATKAAKATGAHLIIPTWTGERPGKSTDMDDLGRDEGRPVVKAQVEAAFTAAKPEAETEAIDAEVVTADAILPLDQHGHRPPRAFALTETGGAELLADRLAGDWRYCQDRNQWVRWTGQLWVFDAGDVAITERSKLIAHEFLAEAQWALKADDARAKVFAQFAATAQRRQFRRAVIDLAKSEPGILIPFSEFDCDAYLLNAPNGTVDLRTGKLRPHSRQDKITRILPWSYDSAATCPRWERFLAEILPDAETVEFVRRAIGYTLTADVSEHVLFSCFGAGANGKSVLLNTLLHVFGPYGTTAPTSMLVAKQHESHPAEKMVLVGKRLVVFQEIPSGQRLNEALTKALVSGDPDQARAMRENFISIRPVAKLWLAGNNHLDIREQTEAIWRRYREIPFGRVFAEDQRDPKLEVKLRDEAPGVLAWCVRACLEWQRAGLGKSGKVQTATADLRSEMDRLGPFLEECCTVSPSATVPRAALYQAFRTWAERQGSHAVSDKGFAELLRGRGFTPAYGRVNGKTARVWQGLGLTDGAPPLPHLPHIPKESPYCPQNQSLREGYREETSESVASVAPDAPDPLATLGHCLRVRPGTTATDADKTALAEHFRGLNGTAEAAAQRLWTYWRADAAPTVAAFLAREPRKPEGAR